MFHLRQSVREVLSEQRRLHSAENSTEEFHDGALENVRTPFMDGLFISNRFSLLCVDVYASLCVCVLLYFCLLED